ncbi:MAG: LysM peptidoglycan-binding domain-containing protein [Bdellovibrionales bacterium]|nr:LysM peptidoglycan-binding domain-containing protein [Bdellovibrionales bacterium]
MDFSEFEDELQDEKSTTGAIPVEEQNLDKSTEDLELEPLEEPDQEVVEPSEEQTTPIEDLTTPEPTDMQAKEPEIMAPISEVSSDLGPNLELEAKLHSIYVNFHNAATPESEWLNMLGSRKSEIYQIQRGDTLWNISEVFFGDGQYWPKIWSVNNKIENPHLINPGNRIQFVMGTLDSAPVFTVTEGKQGANETESLNLDIDSINELIESGALDAADAKQFKEALGEEKKEDKKEQKKSSKSTDVALVEPEIEIPPPTIPVRPVLKRLPPSVPEWQNADPLGEYDSTGISYGERPIARLKDRSYLSSYVDDKDFLSEAEVLEIETGSRIAWELQYIYAKFPKNKATPGEKYLVVENKGRLKKDNKYIETRSMGYQKIISGVVVLGEKVKADVDDEKFDVYRAFVEKAINPVKLGGELVRGELPLVDLKSTGPASDVVAQIIGGEMDSRRKVFGKSSVVFLDKGLADGLSEGQVLSVRANRRVRNTDSLILENDQVIGTLKVVKVADKFATAVITESQDNIYAGDYTGSGAMLSRSLETVLPNTVTEESPQKDRANLDTDSAFDDFSDENFEQDDSSLEKELDEFEGESDFE